MNSRMNYISRRRFLQRSLVMGTASAAIPSLAQAFSSSDDSSARHPETEEVSPFQTVRKNDISIAQWALVNEVRSGEWTTLDFPRIAREVFDINGIEFVNTLFESPTMGYLNQLKQNADDHGVTMVLIMCDAEGDPAQPDAKTRRQFEINHRKWIDAAHYLGCHAIRTNCRGPEGASREDALKWAADTYNMMLEYAIPANVSVLVENHGRISDDADFMVDLMKEVDNKYFGMLPDWRSPDWISQDYNLEYLEKTLPWAQGMSYRNQDTEEQTARMIELAESSGFRGWYGIESNGREAIHKGKELLTKYLNL